MKEEKEATLKDILNEVRAVRQSVGGLETEMKAVRQDVGGLETEMKAVRQDVGDLKEEVHEGFQIISKSFTAVEKRIDDVEQHLGQKIDGVRNSFEAEIIRRTDEHIIYDKRIKHLEDLHGIVSTDTPSLVK